MCFDLLYVHSINHSYTMEIVYAYCIAEYSFEFLAHPLQKNITIVGGGLGGGGGGVPEHIKHLCRALNMLNKIFCMTQGLILYEAINAQANTVVRDRANRASLD